MVIGYLQQLLYTDSSKNDDREDQYAGFIMWDCVLSLLYIKTFIINNIIQRNLLNVESHIENYDLNLIKNLLLILNLEW